ncbi:MAG: hypothetical protein WBE44_15160, partial [Terriglobales bacterium]
PLVGFSTPKVYSGIGADIVMESITLIVSEWREKLRKTRHQLAIKNWVVFEVLGPNKCGKAR